MQTEVVSFLCAALVCGALVPVITRFARRRGLFDHITTSRKIHSRRVPRLGGIAIVAGFYAPLLALILYPTGLGSLFYADPERAFAFLFGGLAIAGLGIFDDIFGCGAVGKFCVQIAVALYMWFAGFRIEDVHLIGDAVLPLGHIGGALLTVMWIVGVMNALNLIDGLDGLAAGIALISGVTSLIIATLGDRPLMGLWMAALTGSLVAFLRFNFSPASIFMGDGGALFIGFVLAVASIRTNQKSTAAVSLLVPIVALALPIADTLLAMLRRRLRGRPVFSGDKEHIHHRLLDLGLSHRQVVLVLYAVAAALGGISIGLATLAPQFGLAALATLGAAALLGLWRLGLFRMDHVRETRRRNTSLRDAVKGITESLRVAPSVNDIIHSVAAFAPALSAHSVRLQLGEGLGSVVQVPSVEAVPAVPSLCMQLPIEPGLGHLVVEWTDGREAPDPDHEIAAESLTRALSRELERTLADNPALDGDLTPVLIRPYVSGRRRGWGT